jgi:hypothetical protein
MLVGSFPTLPRWPTSVRQWELCLTCPLPPPAIEHHHERDFYLNRSSPPSLSSSHLPPYRCICTNTRIHIHIHLVLLIHTHPTSLPPAISPQRQGRGFPRFPSQLTRDPLYAVRVNLGPASTAHSLAALLLPPQLKIPSCGIPARRIARSEPLDQRRSSHYYCELCPFPLRPSIPGIHHPHYIHWPVTSLCRSVLYQQAAARVLSYQLFRCITASPQLRRRQTQSEQPASQPDPSENLPPAAEHAHTPPLAQSFIHCTYTQHNHLPPATPN